MAKRKPEVGDIWKPPGNNDIRFMLMEKYFDKECNTDMFSVLNLNNGFKMTTQFVFIRDCWEFVS